MRKTFHLAIVAPLLATGASLVIAPATAQEWHRGTAAAAPHEGFHPAPVRGAAPGHVLPGGGFHAQPGFHAIVTVHPFVFQHRVFARFTPAERAEWTHGWWHHGWWHGRWGWWWFAGGYWWWYDTPVYPYPTAVSEVYYEEPTYQEETSGYWYYCYNPPGYYPYVQSCNGAWQPVPPNPPPAGYDQGPGYDQGEGYQGEQGPPQGNEEGPPPGYQDNQQMGPPPGSEEGPPPGYRGNQQMGPPPSDDEGPPPGNQGYQEGPPPGYDDEGPPPNSGPGPGYNENQGQPRGDEQGPHPDQEQGPPPNDQGPPPPPQ